MKNNTNVSAKITFFFQNGKNTIKPCIKNINKVKKQMINRGDISKIDEQELLFNI